MKTFFFFCLLLLSLIKTSAQFGPPPQHLTGGEMYYSYQGMLNGEHVYRVTIQCFAKCDNAAHPRSVNLSIFDRLTNILIKRIAVPINSRSTENLPGDLLNDCLVNPLSLCNSVAYYTVDVSLPPSPNGYLLSCTPGYRIEDLANLTEKGYVYATYTAEIPGGDAARNSTFRITSNDLVVNCANTKFSFNFGTMDNEGDELRYYLCDAYQAGLNVDNYADPTAPPPFQPVIYAPNYSGNFPLGANVTVDEQTGLMTGIAPAKGQYVVTICVGEYRNGVLIATQRKEVQINVTNCEIAKASLLPEYLLCRDNNTLELSNLSSGFRVEAFNWQIFNSNGALLFTDKKPTVSYTFKDTGVYSVKLVINKGANQCVDSTTSVVKMYPGLKADFDISEACIGKPATFTNTSTTTFGQINYWKWDFGDYVSGGGYGNADVTGVYNPSYQYHSKGTKQVQLVMGTTMGCRDTLRKTITVEQPVIKLAFRDTLVCVNDNVQLLATAPGGGNFSWMPANNMINSNSNTPTVSPTVTTTYHVFLNDNGCLNRDSVRVRVTDYVFLEVMNDTTICQSDAIQLKAVSSGFKFLWTNVSPENATVRNPTVAPDKTTVYEVTASIGGCSAKDQVVVTTVPYPKANAGNDTLICLQTAAQLSGSTDGSSFSWSPAPTLNNPGILNPVAVPKQTTSYILSAFDNKGCPKAGKDTVVVTVLQTPIISRDTAVIVGQPLQLNASGGTAYRWTPAFGLSAADIANPVATYSSPSEGIRYQVEMSKETGCPHFAYINVKVFATKAQVFVPTAFTPNGDGRNDRLRPIPVGIQHIEYFHVYNRWGQLIFTTKTSGQGWDGTVGGRILTTGVFTWAVKAVDIDGKPYFQKGTVTLIR
ncbi:MAG: gliding motility-associated C-terminal domain-containing protein [Flavisolibacter sp.]|nr:gliding motility-associated C-terminal domain-containing protein [Flavisolibacter sp.]